MKILLVDLEFDYGQPERGLNSIREYGYHAAMKSLGHEVIPFYYDYLLNRKDELQSAVLGFANKTQPDLIFFILFRDQFSTSTLDELKKNFTTINWFGDDTWRFESFTSLFAPHFTYSITTDKFSLPHYKKMGVNDVIVSQWAAIEGVPPSDFSGQYEHDVSFIGAANPYRKWFIKELSKQGIKVECFGMGWKNGPVSNEKMNHTFRHSKINLNLSNSVHLDIRYLFSSVKSLAHSIRSKKSGGQIKARNFEIPYSGGFQLTDYTAGIEDYFEVGKEIICYSDMEDIVRQIRFYLDRDEERELIRKKGEQRARTEHGYSHRFQSIFQEIKV